MEQYSEEQVLLKKIAAGSEKAFRTLFDVYRNPVYAYAYRYLRAVSLSEDVVQDIFMKLWQNREELPAILNIGAYIRVATRNHTIKLLRRQMIAPVITGVAAPAGNEAHQETEELIAYNDTKRMLEYAVERLPPRQQVIYDLCHNEGLKYDEVAARLGISSLTVKTHMQQALRSIRIFMKNHSDAGVAVMGSSLFFF